MSPSTATTAAKKNAGPGYYDLIKEAVLTLKERSGSSRQAIDKFVATKKGAEYSKSRLNIALKKGVEAGKLLAVKGSFKLAAEQKKPVKKVVKKKTADKTTKKPVKKAAATKKAPAASKKPVAEKTKTTSSVGKKDKTVAKKAGAAKKPAKKVASKKPTATKKKTVKKAPASAKKAAKKPVAKK